MTDDPGREIADDQPVDEEPEPRLPDNDPVPTEDEE